MASEETNRVLANERDEDEATGGGPAEAVSEVDGSPDLPGVIYPIAPSEGAEAPQAPREGEGVPEPQPAAEGSQEGTEDPVRQEDGSFPELQAMREELEKTAEDLGTAQAANEELSAALRETQEQLSLVSQENDALNERLRKSELYEQKGGRRLLDALDQIEAVRGRAMKAIQEAAELRAEPAGPGG